jgi:AcrR family transcriptional regulator
MGSTERKEREKQELKELILLKAKEIIIRDGQEKLSIRKLAAEIEYSPATIYLYFHDKDEIIYEMTNLGFSKMVETMNSAYNEPSPTKRIFHIGRAYLEFGLTHRDWYDLMFNSESPIKHIQRCQSEWGHGVALFDFFKASCKEAIIENNLKEVDPKILALQLWSNVHGMVNIANTDRLIVAEPDGDTLFRKEVLAEEVMQSIMKLIFNYTF